jgi:hypothetical protein
MKRKNLAMMSKPIAGENSPFKKIAITITGKESKKVYNKTSPYYGNSYFKLKVITEEDKSRSIFVYPNELTKGKFQQIINLLPNN